MTSIRIRTTRTFKALFRTVQIEIFSTVIVSLATVGFIMAAQPTHAAIVEYRNRAAWQAALAGVVVETVNSLAADLNMMPNGTTTSFGTHTFTSVPSLVAPANGSIAFTTNGASALNIDGSSFLTWSGSTGSAPFVRVDIPSSFGVGIDFHAPGDSTDSDGRPHGSYYFDVTGNSGRFAEGNIGTGKLINDQDEFGAGNVPLTGFYGVIDDQGGITSYRIGTVWTNFAAYGADNFSYATSLAIEAEETPEPSSYALAVAGMLAIGLVARSRHRQA